MTEEASSFDALSLELLKRLKNRGEIKRRIERGDPTFEVLGFEPKTLDAFYQAAHQLLEKGAIEDAVSAFVFLVTIDPMNANYWLDLGASLQLLHDYEGAIDAYEIAAIRKIDDPLPYFYLAKCLFAIHDRVSALQAIDLALEYAEAKQTSHELVEELKRAKRTLLEA